MNLRNTYIFSKSQLVFLRCLTQWEILLRALVGRRDFFFFFSLLQREENSVFYTMEGVIVCLVEQVAFSV